MGGQENVAQRQVWAFLPTLRPCIFSAGPNPIAAIHRFERNISPSLLEWASSGRLINTGSDMPVRLCIGLSDEENLDLYRARFEASGCTQFPIFPMSRVSAISCFKRRLRRTLARSERIAR
jgi:hypothetical protein